MIFNAFYLQISVVDLKHARLLIVPPSHDGQSQDGVAFSEQESSRYWHLKFAVPFFMFINPKKSHSFV